MKEEKYYVYIMQSSKDFSYYIGQTNDLDHRISKHNDGFGKYSSTKRPWKLVYFEKYETRGEAIKREREVKGKKSKIYIKALIKDWSKC